MTCFSHSTEPLSSIIPVSFIGHPSSIVTLSSEIGQSVQGNFFIVIQKHLLNQPWHTFSPEAKGMEISLLPRYPAIFLSSCFDWSDEERKPDFCDAYIFWNNSGMLDGLDQNWVLGHKYSWKCTEYAKKLVEASNQDCFSAGNYHKAPKQAIS